MITKINKIHIIKAMRLKDKDLARARYESMRDNLELLYLLRDIEISEYTICLKKTDCIIELDLWNKVAIVPKPFNRKLEDYIKELYTRQLDEIDKQVRFIKELDVQPTYKYWKDFELKKPSINEEKRK
ncbi:MULTISPECIES: hypothetical protein [Methanothermococcus]|uniref:hypothetical protein n=1 Tax=Methanothermococcus TaxID=155862 RepID=UPI00036AEB93|nr:MULTISPECIES: hypothetical protein [Methanothermococcus]